MLIKNARILTPRQLIENGWIKIYGSSILDVGSDDELTEIYLHDDVIDAQGQLVLPGNICAHTHFYGAFSRGMPIPGNPPDAFPNILKKLWWNLDKSLDADAIFYSALVCLVEAIRYGTTTLVDHHASPNFIQGSLDILEKAVFATGLRVCLSYEVSDRDGEMRCNEGIDENLRFITKCSTNPDERVAAMFGMHASLTLSDKTLEKIQKFASNNFGFHMHAAEHNIDELDCIKKHGTRVVNRFDKYGLLNNRSILAHAVHIDDNEMEIIRSRGCWVSHQPRSNMNNAVGLPKIEYMNELGIKVIFGNDGFSNAMWQEWKAAYLGHKLLNSDPRSMSADLIAKIAMQNNGIFASKIFGRKIGSIEADAAADLIFVDYKPFTDLTIFNLPWHIVFGIDESMIRATMCAGNFLMKDGRLTGVDEEAIIKEARKISKSVWKKYQAIAV